MVWTHGWTISARLAQPSVGMWRKAPSRAALSNSGVDLDPLVNRAQALGSNPLAFTRPVCDPLSLSMRRSHT